MPLGSLAMAGALLLAAPAVHALVPQGIYHGQQSWIDPETPADAHSFHVPGGAYSFGAGKNMTFALIFSDEFNNSKRTFEAGFDAKWTALNHRDTTNMGQHYFLPQAVQVDKGNLIITTSKPKQKYKGTKYVSGSLQTWNKFCFTGGFIEVKAILPGKWGIPGTWPAIWIMGNLGRAAFLDSQDGTWPFSYDYCAPWIEKAQKIEQRINACGNLTDKDDAQSYPETFGLNKGQGRGATEIDVIEMQIRKRDEPAFITTSLQIRPSLNDNLRPASQNLPGPGQWYQGLRFGNFTTINSDYYGENGLDSLSALTQLDPNSFDSYHLYQLDWSPGPYGYIRWWLDGNFLFEIPGEALNVWSDGVPPRMVPAEPSYLILSTAVSEKFSPPCDGEICDSLWPANFTIDYVRVYQGNPNNYTSLGCNPAAFPTTQWIYAHPADYGLPWYTSLPIEAALVRVAVVLNAVASAFFVVKGAQHPRLATTYFSTLWITAAFYAFFSVSSAAEPMAWVHVVLSCLCGVVFGGVLSLLPVGALGGLLGFYVGVAVGEFTPVLVARVLCPVLIVAGVALAFAHVPPKHLAIVSTALLGSATLLMSFSVWVGHGDVARNLWMLTGFVLGGAGYSSTRIITHQFLLQYAVLATLSATGVGVQYFLTRKRTLSWTLKQTPRMKFPPVSASSDARSLKTDEPTDEKINFFSPTKLPRHMQQYAQIFRIAMNVQRSFGFQPANFRNQVEHVVLLLANNARKNGNPYRKLHDLVFSNYSKWCRRLQIPSLHWSETRAPHGGLTAVDEISVDLCLFFFIWGEASNLRHTPEYLCFLFHKMKEEFPAVRHMTREPGFFLDTVITPVYNLLRAQMASPFDHEDRLHYDDFNEFFWHVKCLKFDYKHEDVSDFGASPAPIKRLGQRHGLGATTGGSSSKSAGYFSKRKSIAEAIAESSKSFLEKRTWLTPLRAFTRIFDFHVVTFHLLAALAFAQEQELDLAAALQLVSSVCLTPFVLSVLRDALDLVAVYHPETPLVDLSRYVARITLHLSLTTITMTLYWYAWSYGGQWWTTYYATAAFLHIPGVLNAVLQVLPGVNNWLRRTQWKPVAVVRDLLNPMNRLYVGDNVLDPASASLGYQVFWATLLSWKLFFSYKFEISPLVTPSFLLYADHVENRVSLVTTTLLIAVNWIPFFFVYCVDITIWNSMWVAFTGTFVGFSSRIGEIRNFGRVRAAFSRAADAFNAKIISQQSKTGVEITDALSHSASYGTLLGHEVLDRVDGDASNFGGRRPHDETPLLSFSRRKQTAEELKNQRRQKWLSFSVAWDSIVDSMRGDDLISNREKSQLQFQRMDGYQREIYLPLFQLAGCFETFTSNIQDLYMQESDVHERVLQDKLLELLGDNPMVEESIEEIWELATWVLINILGPCHTNDVRYICSTLNSWAARGVFRALNMQKTGACGKALADVLSYLKANLGAWKSNAKVVPVRKSPSDYSSYQFPTGSGASTSGRPATSGLTKSASTTGLSSLGGPVPRRSRGSGVARIGAMNHTAKPKSKGTHSISTAHITQLRDRMRTFLNLAKSMLTPLDERDPLYAESRGVSDHLTWILTQERGFMWDDDYSGEQVTLTAFERHAETVVRHLHGLLTLQKIDAEPTSHDAMRRLLFFVNSLFMDMPVAPLLEEMKSWSVMTPFYGEDVLYSKSDLESKRDGLDVHTLLFLQTLYKKDWENFLERVKPKKQLWKEPHSALELRLWASQRGQTLTRTVQGMMYYEAAIRLLAQLEQLAPERVEELIKTKFTYVVACQIYGRQKRNNDPKAKDIEFLLHRFPNLRVAYIDEIRVNYQREQSYFAVLIKSGDELGSVEEIYRVRLPGNPIIGEGKPENQNAAVIFTRGETLQTIDMNQDGYIEEALKMRNMLEEFDTGLPDRPYTIVGLPEHIFTGSVSSLANYMALQETSFVTLGQRTLARPLRMRLHYGHPDVFNKLFFMTRGGISKASKGINLSEDIFAGYNNCLRGGSVTFPEYIKCGKGRDVGMQQIYKFEAKLAQGAGEQSLSRDVYRICQRLDFFKLYSFYYNHIGFYLSTSLIIWTVYILLYCNIFRALLTLEGVGGREPVLLSRLQLMLGSVAFFTTAPLLATISVERGFKAAIKEVLMIFVTGGPLYFLFHIGTKWFYFGQTILAGGAKYRATGRGFVTKHSQFDELFRFYASSHLYAGVEVAVGLVLYWIFTVGEQYFAMTWSLWLVVASWVRCICRFLFQQLCLGFCSHSRSCCSRSRRFGSTRWRSSGPTSRKMCACGSSGCVATAATRSSRGRHGSRKRTATSSSSSRGPRRA
jgi:callose synthase